MDELNSKFKNLTIRRRNTGKMKSKYSLYKYQRDVVQWMREKEKKETNGISGGLICLRMGLGKTLIALYHIIRSREKKPLQEKYPSIVILSKTLLYEWKNQGIEKFFDDVKVIYYHKEYIGSSAFKSMSTDELASYDIVFTTYDTCLGIYRTFKYEDTICVKGDYGIHNGKVILINLRDRPKRTDNIVGPNALYEIPWKRLICDESQRFANPSTQTFRSVMAIYAEHRWCLTGTPIRNYDTDIWAQLRFCGFDKVVNANKWKHHLYALYDCDSHIYKLNYKDAEVKMPEKIVKKYPIKMDEKQKIIYTTILKKLENIFGTFFEQRGVSYMFILAMFTRLRQTCIAPHLLIANKSTNKDVNKTMEDIYSDRNEKWLSDTKGTAGIGSPKIAKTIEIIENLPKGEKVLVFSMFVTSLTLVSNGLEDKRIPNVMMIGSTSVKDRVRSMQVFKESTKCNVMLVHYKVGGEGLNLIEATHVIPLEPWWTHAVHDQGIHRSWRRGQEKEVTIHWLLIENSIEYKILEMCNRKSQMANSYISDYDIDKFEKGTGGIDIHGMRNIIFGESEHDKLVATIRKWASGRDIFSLLEELGFKAFQREEVSKMYKKCILQFHPDKVKEEDKERSTEIFKVVNEAYSAFLEDKK